MADRNPPEPQQGLRRHKLITAELRRKVPPLHGTEGKPDPICWARYFVPYAGRMAFYLIERDPDSGTMFGLWVGQWTGPAGELTYVDWQEFAELRFGPAPAWERELSFKPQRLSAVRRAGG